MGPENLHSNKFLGDVDAAGLEPSLRVAGLGKKN